MRFASAAALPPWAYDTAWGSLPEASSVRGTGALTGVTWTCAGADGGLCNPAGSGVIFELVELPAGGSVVVYNFMPLFYWFRTGLAMPLPSKSVVALDGSPRSVCGPVGQEWVHSHWPMRSPRRRRMPCSGQT